MKYAIIIHKQEEPVQVLAVRKWAWLARLYVWGSGASDAGVFSVTQDVAEIIRICEHRDRLIGENMDLRSKLRDRDHQPVPAPAVQALYALVSRNDDGKWATVHAADTELPQELADIVEEVLA